MGNDKADPNAGINWALWSGLAGTLLMGYKNVQAYRDENQDLVVGSFLIMAFFLVIFLFGLAFHIRFHGRT